MKTKKTIILASLVFIYALSMVSAAYTDGSCGMMSGLTGSYGSGMMIFSWITYLLVIGLIIAAIYWLIKSANKKK